MTTRNRFSDHSGILAQSRLQKKLDRYEIHAFAARFLAKGMSTSRPRTHFSLPRA